MCWLKKSNIGFHFLLAFGLMVNGIAQAQVSLRPLTASEIKQQLFGFLMSGEYPSGQPWAERFNKDGTSDYSEKGKVSKGTMTLKGNSLCFSYQGNDQVGGCFEVWKRGKNCFDFYTSSSPTPFLERRFGHNWDARGWFSTQPRTCVSEQIS